MSKINETDPSREEFYARKIADKIQENLSSFIIETQTFLQYSMTSKAIDDQGRAIDFVNKHNRYQVDILVSQRVENHKIPLVVIEVKNKRYGSHDSATYSIKAYEHKRLFPYLRYGFICVSNSLNDILDYRFFSHAYSIDFDMNVNENNISKLIKIVKKQIEISQDIYKRIL